MLGHSLACIRPSSFLPPDPQKNINKNSLFFIDSSLFLNPGTQKSHVGLNSAWGLRTLGVCGKDEEEAACRSDRTSDVSSFSMTIHKGNNESNVVCCVLSVCWLHSNLFICIVPFHSRSRQGHVAIF